MSCREANPKHHSEARWMMNCQETNPNHHPEQGLGLGLGLEQGLRRPC